MIGQGETQRKKENLEGASEGKGQSIPPQSLVWYVGLVRNSQVQLNHHKLFSLVVEAKWKGKRAKEGLAAPFYP